MAVQAMEKAAPEWYTPSDQEGEENPAQYRVAPLDQVQLTEVVPGINYDTGKIEGWAVQRMLTYGLVGWRNVTRADGTELPFSLNNLRQVPYYHQVEAASHILFMSQLTEEERKNS